MPNLTEKLPIILLFTTLSPTIRQELKPFYRVNGAIYLLSVSDNTITGDDDIYENDCYALFMDRKKSIDIDCEDDLDLVEFMLARRNRL